MNPFNRADNQILRIRMEQEKEDFSGQLASCIYVKDKELDIVQDLVQRKDAEIAALVETVSELNSNPIDGGCCGDGGLNITVPACAE